MTDSFDHSSLLVCDTEGDHWIDREIASQRIVEMISRQCQPQEVLSVLCQQAVSEEIGSQAAFFLLKSDVWILAAKGELTGELQVALSRIVPEDLSLALLEASQAGADDCGASFQNGWARHLYSGIGELLGIFVVLAPTPFVPGHSCSIRIASICRLATLAIEQRNLLDELAYKADHDATTGLYNRTCFERMLARRLGARDCRFALLHANLDRFRLINDVMGQPIGNRLLKQVGLRFQSCLRPGEVLARAGGDEFVLLVDAGCGQHAMARADQLLNALKEPFAVDGHRFFVNASIGFGCQGSGSTVESLQREAYVALYHAKRAGKSRSMQFDSSMATTPPERLEMEQRLRSALARGEMCLHYQPQINLSSGLLVGAEVLLRWNPPDLGIISPAAFIPILEETGMILEFGHWVLLEACRQGKHWQEITGRPLRLGVNVSALQFGNQGFVREVEQVLSATGFPPNLLELELTESMFMSDYTAGRATFGRLQQIGITVALDDFGTGHSSLAYLQELPIQRLKIDQLFVRSIGDADVCPPVVNSIIRTAESLRMVTVAEGIETAHQLDVLRGSRCEEGQGYLFSPPVSATEFYEILSRPQPV
jgi:diguanylate cyclase (GGDEF)-like protein